MRMSQQTCVPVKTDKKTSQQCFQYYDRHLRWLASITAWTTVSLFRADDFYTAQNSLFPKQIQLKTEINHNRKLNIICSRMPHNFTTNIKKPSICNSHNKNSTAAEIAHSADTYHQQVRTTNKISNWIKIFLPKIGILFNSYTTSTKIR